MNKLSENVKFRLCSDQRDHDLGKDFNAFLRHVTGRFHDRPCLHFADLRIRDRKTAPAVAEHRVELMKSIHFRFDLVGGNAQPLGHLFLPIFRMR